MVVIVIKQNMHRVEAPVLKGARTSQPLSRAGWSAVHSTPPACAVADVAAELIGEATHDAATTTIVTVRALVRPFAELLPLIDVLSHTDLHELVTPGRGGGEDHADENKVCHEVLDGTWLAYLQ